jgi:hypothetical protein
MIISNLEYAISSNSQKIKAKNEWINTKWFGKYEEYWRAALSAYSSIETISCVYKSHEMV